MDVNSLQSFIAVAEQGSFSLAAERLYLTQPAISKRIASLEQQLGVRLFDRIGKTTHLTEAGAMLLPKARSIILQVEESRQLIRNLSGSISGKLKLGTSHHIGLHRLPGILHDFHLRYPQVALDIQFTDSEIACQHVSRGEIELAIVTLPQQADSTLSYQRLWTDPLRFVCAHHHALAKMPGPLTLQQLTEHEALLPAAATVTRSIVDSAFASQGLTPRIGMETNYLETLKMMVSIGLGWSALPLSMIDASVRLLELQDVSIYRYLGVVQHRERSLSNAARTFVERLQTHIGVAPV